MTAEYPAGYKPMTDEERSAVLRKRFVNYDDDCGSLDEAAIVIEQAVLARLPKPDTSERELLAQRDELLAAGQRVTRAFKALGVSRRFSDELEARAECERAMVALDAAIAKVEGGAK